jgi:putative transposase
VGAQDGTAAVGTPFVGAPDERINGAATRAAPTVGDIVGAFKSSFTVAYIQGVKENQWPEFDRRVWQRNYYEHIIRDETELSRVRRYIDENPVRWAFDRENPQRL